MNRDAGNYDVEEIKLGIEWQMNKSIGFVAMYTVFNRRFEDAPEPAKG